MTDTTPAEPDRWCAGCRLSLPATAFHRSSRRCRECTRVQAQRRRAVDYDIEMERQNGACAICKKPPVQHGQRHRLVVDHDYETGLFRGLICDRCNLMVGYADDDPERFLAAIEYLKRPGRPFDLPDMSRRYPVTVSYQKPSSPKPGSVFPTATHMVQPTHQRGSR